MSETNYKWSLVTIWWYLLLYHFKKCTKRRILDGGRREKQYYAVLRFSFLHNNRVLSSRREIRLKPGSAEVKSDLNYVCHYAMLLFTKFSGLSCSPSIKLISQKKLWWGFSGFLRWPSCPRRCFRDWRSRCTICSLVEDVCGLLFSRFFSFSKQKYPNFGATQWYPVESRNLSAPGLTLWQAFFWRFSATLANSSCQNL